MDSRDDPRIERADERESYEEPSLTYVAPQIVEIDDVTELSNELLGGFSP